MIVTLGKNGCYMKTASEELRLPAENFLSIDNTGAGDAFISALASYLLYGYEMKDAIRIANLAAGFSVTRRGVAPALIDKSTLDALHPPEISHDPESQGLRIFPVNQKSVRRGAHFFYKITVSSTALLSPSHIQVFPGERTCSSCSSPRPAD